MLRVGEFEGCPINLISKTEDSLIVKLEYKKYFLEIEIFNNGNDRILSTNMKKTQLAYNRDCLLARSQELFENAKKVFK